MGVQDSDRYDKDYVKDENDDGGYWKAQMAYDQLKQKVIKERMEMEKALAKEREEKKEVEKAVVVEEKAEKAHKIAGDEEEEANQAEKKADADHDVVEDHLDESTDEVETEVKGLE